MASQPPSPTTVLKTKFEDLYLSSPSHQEQEQESEFHYFALLPAELRLKIYTLSLPGPRLIPIHYLSANTTPPPSPSPYSYSTSYPPQKRICRRRPTITTSPQNPSHTGCTSPAAIPALLHVNREARLLASSHYTLSFSLAGPFFEPKIWFRQGQDVLYFPAVPGFLATVKHWTSICCLIKGGELGMVRRLAVHEDLFLEERKRREILDSGVGWDREDGDRDWDVGEGVVEERVRDFWEVVKRRYSGLEEVFIVGVGREGDVCSYEMGEGCGEENAMDVVSGKEREFCGEG